MSIASVMSIVGGGLSRSLRVIGSLFVLLGAVGLGYCAAIGGGSAPSPFLNQALQALLAVTALSFGLVGLDMLVGAFQRHRQGISRRLRQVGYGASAGSILLFAAWVVAVIIAKGL